MIERLGPAEYSPARLATAQWEDPRDVAEKYRYDTANFWLGRTADMSSIGFSDDRHICLVSGPRGGKGASIIINNLCYWPGPAVVIDPKGENAAVTVARRGRGDAYCAGMGQTVHVLDPFNEAKIDDSYRASFNPLDALDPACPETVDEAARVANSLVVVKDERPEPFFDEAARAMLRGVILHVVTSTDFAPQEKTLLTVHKLLKRGDWQSYEAMQEEGRTEIDPPHKLLWRSMEINPAFDGLVASDGIRFQGMLKNSDKTYECVLQTVLSNLEFLESPGMRKTMARSDFQLSELKTDPRGMTLYLSLPQRYMDTHYRWLRMMVTLITAQMEITTGMPAVGHRVLMVLDEFAGLKRMTAIENAAAQLAGFQVKLFFVLQTLEQLKAVYKESWETFLGCAGLKVFFSIDDNFTREYVSKQMGDTELVRVVRSENEGSSASHSQATGTNVSKGTTASKGGSASRARGSNVSEAKGSNLSTAEGRNASTARGRNQSDTFGDSETFSLGWNVGESRSHSTGTNWSSSHASSRGGSKSTNWSRSRSSNASFGQGYSSSFGSSSTTGGSTGTNWGETDTTSEGGSMSDTVGKSSGSSTTKATGHTTSHSDGTSFTETDGHSTTNTRGSSVTHTDGSSTTETDGTSWTDGTSASEGKSETATRGTGSSRGQGLSETIHRRPLVRPEEIGKLFARIDNTQDPLYPGLALVLVTGGHPLIVRRALYFKDPQFIDCFSPHPVYTFVAPQKYVAEDIRPLLEKLAAARAKAQFGEWQATAQEVVFGGQTLIEIAKAEPGGKTVSIGAPVFGKLTERADNVSFASAGTIASLFSVKYYSGEVIDPFKALRETCAKSKPPRPPSPPRAATPSYIPPSYSPPSYTPPPYRPSYTPSYSSSSSGDSDGEFLGIVLVVAVFAIGLFGLIIGGFLAWRFRSDLMAYLAGFTPHSWPVEGLAWIVVVAAALILAALYDEARTDYWFLKWLLTVGAVGALLWYGMRFCPLIYMIEGLAAVIALAGLTRGAVSLYRGY